MLNAHKKRTPQQLVRGRGKIKHKQRVNIMSVSAGFKDEKWK